MQKPKSLFLDFEFNEITEDPVNLVCCVTLEPVSKEIKQWWLHGDPKAKEQLAKYLRQFKTLVAYSGVAEGRSLLALGLDPLKFEWIDLFLEYRCLSNHNDELNYGDQLIDGVVKKTFKPKPKWEVVPGEIEPLGFRPTHSLAESGFKLLGIKRDTYHKDLIRDKIISNPQIFTEEEMNEILKYCEEDVIHLPNLWEKMKETYFKKDPSLTKNQLIKEAKIRGRYAAHTAHMESKGYPIDFERTFNFSHSVANILFDCQREINQLFPEISPFRWDRKSQKFSWDQIKTREWVSSTIYKEKWEKTETKQLSLSLEAFEKFFKFKHDYPRDNFGAQMVRYLKLKQSLYGFVPTTDKKRKTFWDYVGQRDQRVRAYFNIYGAQSGRSQPSSSGFMYLKPAWMRALVQPKPGMAMAGIDYGSQEFFISALLSRDQNMIASYLSGDVYLAFAKLAGMIPMDGSKETHKKERDLAKSTVLGISYMMSRYGLAIKLTEDSGREWTEDEAQDMIDRFYEAYPDLKDWQDGIIEDYQEKGFMKLQCGWYMFGDNENFRSVGNVPSQGLGASVMRKAVDLAVSRGVYVCKTLHDALYIEYPVGREDHIQILKESMREAFVYYFDEDLKETASKIKMDPFAWSPNYEPDSEIILPDGSKVYSSNIHIDDRAINDYNNFSKYFNKSEEQEIL